jgi:ferredoxin
MRNQAEKVETSWRVSVNHRLCLYCGACVAVCPSNAIFLGNSALSINPDACTVCKLCIQACPVRALFGETLELNKIA